MSRLDELLKEYCPEDIDYRLIGDMVDYQDLLAQMKRYMYRSNRIPMQLLGWLSPVEYRAKLNTL